MTSPSQTPPASERRTGREADTDRLAAARDVLGAGGLVVYPTDTLYGLGCVADDRRAFERLARVKGLPPGRGVSLLFDELEQTLDWAAWGATSLAAARRLLPGPVTLLVAATERAPTHVLGPGNTLALRIVDRAACRVLAAGRPVVSTSANRHGEPSATTVDEARRVFGDEVGAYVDVGPLDGPPSTVVDLRELDQGDGPKVIREGALSRAQVLAALDTLEVPDDGS